MLVQRQATFLPVSYLSTEGSNPFARILRTSIFFLRAAIPKWCPLLRMRRGAGCWQPKRRLPPAATSDRLRSLQSAPPSMLLSHKGAIARNTKVAMHIFCAVHPPSNPHLRYFLFYLGQHIALSCVAFSCLDRQNELDFIGAIS